MMPQLSIVTVLYGGVEVLRETLPTWREAGKGRDVEWIFVDHSPQSLAEDLGLGSWAEYVWDASNPGFAAGVNRAVSLARSDVVGLINPDIFLDESKLAQILALPKDQLCALTLDTHGAVTTGIGYTSWGFCVDRQEDRPLVGPSGGGAVIPRTVMQHVGGFPEHLFAWGEDAEWALTAYALGVRTISSGVTVSHVGGHSVASLAGQRLKARLLARNRVATYRRVFTTPLKALLAVPFLAALLANGLRKIPLGMGRAYFRGLYEGTVMPVPEARARVTVRMWLAITRRTRTR